VVPRANPAGGPSIKRMTSRPTMPRPEDEETTVEQTTEPIDELIGQVEKLYQSLTGQEAPAPRETPYAPIPPEKDPERHLSEQVDRLLTSLGPLSPATTLTRVWVPSLTLWETPTEIWVCLDLPGVTRETVQVRVLGRGMLEVSGERRAPRREAEARRLHDESPRGPFRRVVALPPRASIEHIEARVREGVLEIRMPLMSTPEPEARAVPVT
jgi:HSP20 family protein